MIFSLIQGLVGAFDGVFEGAIFRLQGGHAHAGGDDHTVHFKEAQFLSQAVMQAVHSGEQEEIRLRAAMMASDTLRGASL